jgi:hypothetical protein
MIGFCFVAGLAYALHHARLASIAYLWVLVFHSFAKLFIATLFIGVKRVVRGFGVVCQGGCEQMLVAKASGAKEIRASGY